MTYGGPIGDGIPTFGLVLSVMALLGLVVSWRRRSARMLALLWLACTVLALGVDAADREPRLRARL